MCYFNRSEKIILQDGMLTRSVTAHGRGRYEGKSLEVARISEDGKMLARNIGFSPMCGYQVYWLNTHELEDWGEPYINISGISAIRPSEADKLVIIGKYPEFKWILKKADLTTAEIFKLLPLWKKYPKEVDCAFNAPFKYIAMNSKTYKLKPETKRKVLQWLKENPADKFVNLSEVLACIKNKCDLKTYRIYATQPICYQRSKVPLDCIKHAVAHDMDIRVFGDYLYMAGVCGHDLSDPYWRYPKDLKKAHAKVAREKKRIDALKEKEAREAKQSDYSKTIKKMLGKEFSSANIRVYVPEKIKQIEHQAKVLNQCLITCDYIQHVIDKKCVLVFVERNKKPFATAELLLSGRKFKLGQFYGDERKMNCIAKPEAKAALKKWAETNKVRIVA